MPTVPTLGGQRAAPTSNPGTTFSAAPMQDFASQQLQQAGAAMTQAGGAANSIAIDMQQQVNQVRVDAALNKFREQQLKLTYDQESGFKTLKGDAALTRPDGQHLAQEYGGKLRTTASELAGSLSNDVQRQAFQRQVDDMALQFQGSVEQHALSEYRDYALSTQSGTIKIAVDEAKLNWNNPERIQASIDSIGAATLRAGTLQGLSGSEIMAQVKIVTSSAHMGAIDAALQNNNPDYVIGYIERFKSQMTADDLLKARGTANKEVYARAADDIATSVVSGYRAKQEPDDLSRMAAITMQSESGGRETGVDGNILTSPKGAKGSMQVLDSTLMNPGYGLPKLPADATPAQRAEQGRNYLSAMVKNYAGDASKAWAAYNWGPGKVDAAIKQAGANWLSLAPKETRDYVAKNMAALQSDAPPPAMTLQQVQADVRKRVKERFGPTPPMTVMKQALEASSRQFEENAKAIKADEDAREANALRALAQNGGRFSELPFAIRSQIPPDKLDNVLTAAGKIALGVNVTNPAVYLNLSSPEKLAGLSDDQFFKLKIELSDGDFKHFTNQRAAMAGKSTNKAGDVNMPGISSVLNTRLQTLGIDPTPKDGSDGAMRVGAIRKYVTDSVLSQQAVSGKQMTDAEIEKHVDGLFAKSTSFRTTFLGFDTGGTSTRMLTQKIGDIPSETVSKLRADFRAQGIDPTDADLLGAYWRIKPPSRKPLGQTASGKIKPKS